SDQELPSAHHASSGAWVQGCLPYIRLARGIGGNLIANAFELPPPNVLEVLTIRSGRCRLIKINRNLVTLPNLLAHMPRHRNTVFEPHTFDGDERHNVGRAHPRMGALVLI